MTFDDPWLLSDDDILDRTCLIEIPAAVIQTTADEWGLGASTSVATPEYVSLDCMEIPQRLFIDRTEGVTKAVSIGLIIKDTDGIVDDSRRLQFNGVRYQVTNVTAPLQHDLKRVLLTEISGGN